jgi:hypothetical protein
VYRGGKRLRKPH